MADAYEHKTFEIPSSTNIVDALKRIGDDGWEVTYYRADHSRGGQFSRWVEARRPHRGTRAPKWEYKEFSTNSDGRSEEADSEGWQAAIKIYEYYTGTHWLFKRTVA